MGEVDPKAALGGWLSRDHGDIHALLESACDGPNLRSEPFARFRERLLRHIGIEEKLLFRALRRADPDCERERLARLRVEHAALTSLLVPTPDLALANEIRGLLESHNALEEGESGVYASCLRRLPGDEVAEILERAKARAPVPTTGYFDGPGTVRTVREALAKARGSAGLSD